MDSVTEVNFCGSVNRTNIERNTKNFFGLRAGIVCLLCLMLLMTLSSPNHLYANEIDYQSLQEDPLETAYRKLASPGDIEWDEEEMVSGGAPTIISDMKWPLNSG